MRDKCAKRNLSRLQYLVYEPVSRHSKKKHINNSILSQWLANCALSMSWHWNYVIVAWQQKVFMNEQVLKQSKVFKSFQGECEDLNYPLQNFISSTALHQQRRLLEREEHHCQWSSNQRSVLKQRTKQSPYLFPTDSALTLTLHKGLCWISSILDLNQGQ